MKTRLSSWRRAISSLWNDTNSALKIACMVLWVAGAVMLVLGIWGDSTEFWSDKPFLTNAFSGLTAAAFGIPLGLVVLERVRAAETHAADKRAAQRLAGDMLAALMSTVTELGEGKIANIQTAISRFQDKGAKADGRWKDAASPEASEFKGAMPDFFRLCREAIDFVESDFEGLLKRDRAKLFADISAQWSFLKTEVRSRLLETKGEWLTENDVQKLEGLVAIVTKSELENSVIQGSKLKSELSDNDKRLPRNVYSSKFRAFDSWVKSVIKALNDIVELYKALERAALHLESKQREKHPSAMR